MATNVPFPVLADNGFQTPPESAIFTGIMADLNQAFGGGLNLDPVEPQGQLGVSFTRCVAFFQDLFAAYVARVDPATSSGRMQDGLGRIYFMTRIPAQSTTVVATCTGAVGTVIPAGALAKTAGGDVYAAVAGGTIPSAGHIDLEFSNLVAGPIACPAGFLTALYQSVPGWDTITNAADGALGRDVEGPTAFEARRAASVASNAQNIMDAVRGTVLGVPGVLDAYVVDNPTAAPVTIGGVSVGAHAMFVSVFGGADADVARAIWTKKAPGCDYTGTTTVTVEDTSAGYVGPFPSYSVKFTRAALLPVGLAVSLANNSQVPADAVAKVQGAILSVFNGTDASGNGRPRIGGRLYANRFYGAIIGLGAWAQIVNIQLGCSNDADAVAFTGDIAANVLTVSAVAAGTLATGQRIIGALPGTVITGQTGGTTGGVGTYTVSNPQTLASGPLSAAASDQPFIDVHIDQLPSVNVGDITVALV